MATGAASVKSPGLWAGPPALKDLRLRWVSAPGLMCQHRPAFCPGGRDANPSDSTAAGREQRPRWAPRQPSWRPCHGAGVAPQDRGMSTGRDVPAVTVSWACGRSRCRANLQVVTSLPHWRLPVGNPGCNSRDPEFRFIQTEPQGLLPPPPRRPQGQHGLLPECRLQSPGSPPSDHQF